MSYVDLTGSGQSVSAHTVSTQPRSRRNRKQLAKLALSRAINPVLHLEGLEQRTMLSTLPTPVIGGRTDISGGGDDVNRSAPSIAYDPSNPQKLVTVFTSDEPGSGGTQKVFVRGAFSRNGGISWSEFDIPGNIGNPTYTTPGDPPFPYILATDATVAFDSNDNFYVAYLEHTGNYDSGAIVTQKFSFADQEPEIVPEQLDTVVYQWSDHDAAYTPMLVVDNNQVSFSDPDIKAKQEDEWSGNVYIAWSTDDKAPTGAVNYNASTIRMAASTDGGLTFGPALLVDGNHSGPDKNAYPQLVVSQGTSDDRVLPGQVTVLWDDYNSGHGGGTPVDFLKAGLIQDGASVFVAHDKDGGAIDDALPPPQGSSNSVPVDTPFVLPVDITDPRFDVLTDIDVFFSINSEALADLSIVLSDPAGNSVTLVRNKTSTGGTQTNGRGLSGQKFGIVNDIDMPVTFDGDAARAINDNNISNLYTGHFRPEQGQMSVFAGQTAADISGDWTLTVTDNHNGSKSVLRQWGLQLHSGMTVAESNTVANTRVLGAAPSTTFPLKTAAMPARGVGPGAVIASDNTLGSYSPNQGRLYVAYTDRVVGSGVPADDTDIYLAYSDDGGVTWDTTPKVNADDGRSDGFSEAIGTVRGRAQFMPSVAVDQSTGTLVLTWYDGRHDPARAQVAQYITTSLDGGLTFGGETFLNDGNVVTDAITGNDVTKGPIPDNQSSNNGNRETTYGFGLHQGVVAVGGQVFPVWSGNLNGGPTGTELLHIHTAATTIAAGPRIIKSTMGPVSLTGDLVNPGATDGSPKFSKFEVEFDRPVDPASFNAASVKVFYRSPTTLGTAPGIGSVTVTSVVPQDVGPFGATKFTINLSTPQTAIGTYSYAITPDIRDRIRNLGVTINPLTPFTTNAQGANINKRIPASGTGGGNTDNDLTTSVLTVSGVPTDQVISSMTVKVSLTHPYDDDLVLTLIAPDGRRILLANRRGGAGDNYTNTVFDDNAGTTIAGGVAPFTGSFVPDEPLTPLQGLNPNGDWKLEIRDSAPGDIGNLVAWSVTITPGDVGPGLGNRMDQNMDAVAGEPASAASTGDVYAIPTPIGELPYNGSFFLPAFSPDTAPIIIPGPHVIATSVAGNPVTTDNLVLNKTVSNIDVTFDRPMNAATFTPASIIGMLGPIGGIAGPFTVSVSPLDPTPASPHIFRIGFPAQALSGSYTLSLASTIKSAAGDSLDSNLNAGVDALRLNSSTTVNVVSTSADTPQAIGTKVVESTINITDAFLIKGATLSLNITYPNDPDLTATLIAPDGTEITLFDKVGLAGASKANFSNTVFDDTASTPIQNGAAPFASTFNPQLPLSVLLGKLSTGKWTLQIRSSGVQTGTLNSWSITLKKPVPGTGLGEFAADQAAVGFRIFNMDVAKDQSHTTWTAVGAAAVSTNENAGRVGGIAVDPSDPSGNTVYAAGASGGVWKTANFLTTNPQGPTWVPLTDFGPTYSLNIGSIAVFGRNNDPSQSIIFAATGNGDTLNIEPNYTSQGVGFLRSMDGGATWTLLDSTNNVDAQGAISPISAVTRDHKFVGTTAFKVLVDPKPTPTGDVIVYAALSGTNGGVWRSLDSGKHWLNMRAGQATDVVFDLNSGFFDAFNNPTGNLQYVFAGFQGDGIYFSPDRGQVWNKLLGGVGNPLIRDNTTSTLTAVNPAAPPTLPNGAKGRITLAKPHLTGNVANDVQYQGWLYALVAADDQKLDGIYLTKDFGFNWTKLHIPITSTGSPSNDTGLGDLALFGTAAPRGNYDQSLEVDPTNPAVIYVGGLSLIRIDTTFVHDAHSFYEDDASGSGELRPDLNNGVVLKQWPSSGSGGAEPNAINTPYINLLRDPSQPFLSNATVNVFHATSFTNDGGGVTWTFFDTGSANEHRIVTTVDPLTGKSRIIAGGDFGLFTAVDDGKGGFVLNYGNQTVSNGSRNGNIQLAAYNYGAVQPSNLAAQIAGAMFYAQSNDFNGGAQSAADILATGNIAWVGPIGAGGGVATDQTGTGTAYRFNWPLANGFINGNQSANAQDFFMVTPPGSAPGTGIGRTFGLLQASGSTGTGDPQWPSLIGENFAVNPVNKDQIIISSRAGRIFATGNQGVIWTEVGNPTALDSSYAPALAYGAPDPAGPGGADAVNFFLYAGTESGKIFVTFNGGGANGNEWKDISAGLTNAGAVKQIITNPSRGSHEAYAVTDAGVFYMADSNAANAAWVNITGNLKALTHNSFGDPTLAEAQAKFLNAIAADWRYAIQDNLNDPTSPLHPALYVAANSGVYRSFDKGKTWTLFPNQTTDAAPADGGYMPSVSVTDLDLAVGKIDPTTGAPTVANSPDLLYATTFGRGSFAIRIAPTIVPGTLKLVGTPGGQTPLVFSGISQITALGNKVRVSLFNLTAGQNTYVAGWNGTDNNTGTDIAANRTDAKGAFSITVQPNQIPLGTRVIGVKLTDDAGVSYTGLLTFPPAVPSTPDLVNASDTGRFNNDNLTNDTTPTFSGVADPGVKVTILSDGIAVGNSVADAQGNWTVTTSAIAAGVRNITATATDIASNVVSNPSSPLVVTIDVAPPPAPSVPDMIDASDSGNLNNDNITNVQIPTFKGTAEAGASVTLFEGATPLGTAIADATTGDWQITSASLGNGSHSISARATDIAGNLGPASTALVMTVDVILPATPGTPDLLASSDDGASNTDNVTGVTTPTFTGTADPNIAVELFSDGVSVGTGTSNAAGVWTITSSGLSGGVHSITAKSKDVAGNVSLPSVGLTVTITSNVPTPSAPDLSSGSDDGASNADNITSVTTPTFTGTGQAGLTVELLIGGNTVVGSATVNQQGNWSITVGSPLAVNTYSFTARQVNGQQVSPQSSALSVQIVAPSVGTPSTPDLTPITDTGSSNTDNLTSQVRPQFQGTGPANTLIEILIGGTTVVGSGLADAQGKYLITIDAPGLTEGVYNFSARSNNNGNLSSLSGSLQVNLDTTAPGASGVPDLLASSDLGPSNTDNVTSDNTPTFSGTAPANTIVDLMANNTVFGTATSNAQGQWTITSSALPNGTYLFTSRTRDTAGNTSALSAGLQVTITNSPPPPPPLSITSFSLVNADTGKDIFEMTEGMTLDLSTLPKNLAVRANPAPTNIASVKFGFDTTPGVFNANYRIESLLPYALFADSNNGTKYNAGSFQIGNHTLVGTPYAGKTATGTVGDALTLHFKVTNGQPVQQPTVTSFSLINASTDQVIKTLVNGETLNLSQLPSQLAIRANTSGTPVGSVRFGWDSTPGNFNSNFRTESGAPYTLFGDGNGGADYFAGNIAVGNHTLKGQVFSGSGATGQALGSLQVSFTVTKDGQPPDNGNLPTGWIAGDVGSVGAAGSTSFSNGTWTVKGDGSDIYGTADSFQFARQTLSGNGTITARVVSMDNTDANAKAGIMIRESSAAGSTEASIVLTPTSGIKFVRRTSTGGSTSVTTVASLKAPYYLRLTRNGTTITAQYSSNGTTWTTLGSISLSMNSDVLIGLAVSSHKSGTLNTSVFDNVTVS